MNSLHQHALRAQLPAVGCNPQLHLSVFPDKFASTITRESLAWLDFVRRIEAPDEFPAKDACPLLKLARFGSAESNKGALRHDDNMHEVYGIEGDYDDELVSLDEAADRVAALGIEALFYTSASHRAGAPRWRVLCPLATAHPRADRAMLAGLLNAALGGILNSESFTDSQSYYFGKVRGAEYRTRHVRGQPLDTFDLVLEPAYPSRDTQRQRTTKAQRMDQAANWDAGARRLHELGLVKSATADGEALNIECPFAEEHTTGDTETTVQYRLPHTKGFARGTFVCLHGHCRERPQLEFLAKIGIERDAYLTLKDRSDTGNANLLIELTGGDLRYCPERRVWLHWDGSGWQVDRFGAIAAGQALRVAQQYQQQATALDLQAKGASLDDKERKALGKAADSLRSWATHCRNKRALDAMLERAAKDQRVQLPVDQLDRDPQLMGVANGVVDLRTGELRAAAREDLVTKRSPYAYRADAPAARWARFITEITGAPAGGAGFTPRPKVATYLQCALGYSLTGSTAEHKMFLAIGTGANGKNVLLDIAQEVMGDYCQTIAPEALTATRHDADAERPTPTAAGLAGARAAISSESKDGQRLDVALVKRHTGGGFMTARLMRENTFRFPITHKLWLMTNHRPALDHLDDAIRGRLHLIPFDRTWNRPGHPDPDPALPDGDKDLMPKLRAEGEGILAWMVAGAVKYHKQGLQPPAEVVAMTQQFFREQDPLGRWLDLHERCEPFDGTGAEELLRNFCDWLMAEGETDPASKSAVAFAGAMKSRNVPGDKNKHGKFYGLRERAAVTGDGL